MSTSPTFRFQATVTDLTYQGYGVIQHPSGKVFFAKGVWPQDIAEFEIDAVQLENKKVTFAKMLNLLTPSHQRVTPSCEHHGFAGGQCQGCSWMMVSYESQLAFKQKRIVEALQNAKITFQSEAIKTIWPSDRQIKYRNRVQMKTDGRNIGYVSPEDHRLVPIQSCDVLAPALQKILKDLRKTLPNPQWFLKPQAPLLNLEFDDGLRSADVVPNQKLPFKQGNRAQNQKMKEWLRASLQNVNRHIPVLELFCGSGNFTEVLADCGFLDVGAVESDATAIFSLKQKGYAGVQAVSLNLYDSKSFPAMQLQFGRRELLVLDPPREGLQNQQKTLFKTFPKLHTIIYISCDPESWARDVQYFQSEEGFQLKELQPLDLFPQTPHVEILSVLVKA